VGWMEPAALSRQSAVRSNGRGCGAAKDRANSTGFLNPAVGETVNENLVELIAERGVNRRVQGRLLHGGGSKDEVFDRVRDSHHG
jgi:hypothetical protein